MNRSKTIAVWKSPSWAKKDFQVLQGYKKPCVSGKLWWQVSAVLWNQNAHLTWKSGKNEKFTLHSISLELRLHLLKNHNASDETVKKMVLKCRGYSNIYVFDITCFPWCNISSEMEISLNIDIWLLPKKENFHNFYDMSIIFESQSLKPCETINIQCWNSLTLPM